MKELESDLQQSLKDCDHTLAKPHIDRQEATLQSSEQWTSKEWLAIQKEHCIRMYQDENYRKEVAKNQF